MKVDMVDRLEVIEEKQVKQKGLFYYVSTGSNKGWTWHHSSDCIHKLPQTIVIIANHDHIG